MTLGKNCQADFVDMDKMVRHITKEIDSFWEAYESDNVNRLFSIHKVPQHMFEVDKSSYEPIVLSIGPYHHGSQNLAAMEKEKWKSLDYILKLNCKVSLQGYLRAISKVAKQARSCYPEDIGVDRKLFLQMLLLDSSFILVKVDGTILAARSIETQSAEVTNQGAGNSIIEEIGVHSDQIAESQRSKHERASENSVHEIELSNCQMETGYDRRYCAQSVHHHQYDCNMVADWYANYAWHDLFLLENQIPFFIIETVYEQAVSNGLTQAVLKKKLLNV